MENTVDVLICTEGEISQCSRMGAWNGKRNGYTADEERNREERDREKARSIVYKIKQEIREMRSGMVYNVEAFRLFDFGFSTISYHRDVIVPTLSPKGPFEILFVWVNSCPATVQDDPGFVSALDGPNFSYSSARMSASANSAIRSSTRRWNTATTSARLWNSFALTRSLSSLARSATA